MLSKTGRQESITWPCTVGRPGKAPPLSEGGWRVLPRGRVHSRSTPGPAGGLGLYLEEAEALGEFQAEKCRIASALNPWLRDCKTR